MQTHKSFLVLFLIVVLHLLLAALFTPGNTANSEKVSSSSNRVAAANTGFGFNLLSRLQRGSSEENLFVSPASITWCLSMVLNGAEGETQKEIARVLEVEGLNLRDVNGAYRDWKNSWGSLDPKIEIEVANSIWSRRGLGIRPEFIELNKTFFGAEVTELDFNDPRALTTMNSWVKDKTRAKINKIVDQINPDSVLFLINAIYFHGKWAKEFNVAETKEEPFLTSSGTRKDVRSMRQRGTFRYQERPQFQAIGLPYGNGRLSMYVFLPSKESSLKAFQDSLTLENWDQWMKEFDDSQGEIVFPRFRVEYDAALNGALQALGMRAAFDPQLSDFGAMISQKAFISNVKHKAFVEVTEEGTEAAAATSTEIQIVSMPVQSKTFRMVVNRPFFFAIRDNSSGLVLFLGSIVDPKS